MKLPNEVSSVPDVGYDLLEAIVRDCANVVEAEILSPEDEKYDNEVSEKIGEGTYANQMLKRCVIKMLRRYGLEPT